MKSLIFILVAACCMKLLAGCASSVTGHHFAGLGRSGDPHHPVSLNIGRFYKSKDGAWHFSASPDYQLAGPETLNFPFAFAVSSKQKDFTLQTFTVRDDAGVDLSFVELGQAHDDHPESADVKFVLLLAPKEYAEATMVPSLKKGLYLVEIRYLSEGISYTARWRVAHRVKQEGRAWEFPTS
jgi:hypothetical protein